MANGRPGRPTTKTPELLDEIVEWLSCGNTLRSFCRQPGKPKRRTVDDWRAEDPEFSARVARAREDGDEELAEEILEIADDTSEDFVEVDGRMRVNNEAIARSRLRVDARLKILACRNPFRYGSKLQVGGAADLPPVQLTNDQRVERINEILGKARARLAQIPQPNQGDNRGKDQPPEPSASVRHEGHPRRRAKAAKRTPDGA